MTDPKAAATPEPVGVVMEVSTLPVIGVYGAPAKSFLSPSAKEKRAMWFRDMPIGTQLYAYQSEQDQGAAMNIDELAIGPLGRLGARLAELLDDDQWNNIEPMLITIKADHEAALAEAVAKRDDQWATAIAKYTPFDICKMIADEMARVDK